MFEWNNLEIKIRKANTLISFKNSLLRFGYPTAKATYGIHNPIDLKFLTRSRLGLSHLNKHKFKYNNKDCVNPLCLCTLEIKESLPIFLTLFPKHMFNSLR